MPADRSDRPLVEGFARVVSIEGGCVLAEPEPLSSCGGCASAASCGVKSEHGNSGRTKRFVIANDFGGQIGDRIVVGIAEGSLVRASLTAYMVPLLAMIVSGVTAQNVMGSDAAAAIGAVFGLALGILVARYRAAGLSARGDLTPRFIRHATDWEQGEDCHTE